MSLSHGRDLFMIPGPSVMPDRVLRAMQRPAPNIYEGELLPMTDSILSDISKIAGSSGKTALYICNGHGVWEAAISNLLAPGDHALMLANGRFGEHWALHARAMGVEVELLHFGMSGVVDPDAVEQALRRDKNHRIRLVTTVQTDTASTGRNDIPAIRAAMDAAGHPALLAVDAIASFACEPLHMDAWGVDLVVTACQKGLMTPPGVGYLVVGPKAEAAAHRVKTTSPYWDWALRIDPEIFSQRFNGTAPTHHLFAQREALDMILEEGIDTVWKRHERFAKAIWAAVESWGEGGNIRLNIANPTDRSHSVTSIRAEGTDLTALRAVCEHEFGLTLGIGLGFAGPEHGDGRWAMRIGHMGHLNPPMLLGALATIEAGMRVVGIPFGAGGAAKAAGVIAG